MSGQNNMYGSQDDPFGYGQQQAYWQKQRADDASAAKPVPIKQSVPTTPQVQPRMPDRSLRRDRPDLMPINFGGQPYQSPYGRGYVPPNGGSLPLPNPGTQGGGKVVNKAVNTGLVWRTGPNGERVNIPFDAIGTPLDPQSPNYQPITVGPTPPPGFDNIQSPYGRGYVPPNGGTQQIPTPQLINGDGGSMEPWLDAGMTYEQWMNRFRTASAPNPQIPPWAVQPPSNIGTWNPPTQPALGIWNGPLPSKQPLPEDIYGFSKIYGKPIPEGQKWADVRPDRGWPQPQPQPWNPPTQPALGIWNGSIPPRQPQQMPQNWNPNDAASWESAAASRGMNQRVGPNTLKVLSSRYNALIAQGATPQDAMNNVLSLLTPAEMMGGQQQAIPQWYGARLNQVR